MPSASRLSALIAEQAQVEERVNALSAGPQQTLAVGRALLALADRAHEAVVTLSPLLDPAVQAERREERERLGEDLELLDWLLSTAPESPDVGILTLSLIRRMRQRIDRDRRLLARTVALQPPSS